MSSAFLPFSCKFNKKIIFYLPVKTDKLKFVAFLVFVCTTVSFIAQISSSENSSKRDAILASVAKQPKIFRVTVANQNARKLLFTDLVNTNEGYFLASYTSRVKREINLYSIEKGLNFCSLHDLTDTLY